MLPRRGAAELLHTRHYWGKIFKTPQILLTHRNFAEAPWSAAEWAVALRFVELLQAQLGRQVPYYY